MWAQIINIIAGLWLMVAPSLFHYNKIASDTGHIAGPLIATFAITAIWDVNRQARWLNIPIGLWLLVAPWLQDYPPLSAISDSITGIIVIGCSLVKGRVKHNYGGGWRSLLRKNPEHNTLQG